MIRYNLNKLLGERNLKISKVFVDTGISRSTLTKIVNNQSSMVQTETIDKLCQYLKIDVSDFFEYIPIEIDVNAFFNEYSSFGVLGMDLIIKIKDTLHNQGKEFVYSINENENTEDNIFQDLKSDGKITTLKLKFPISFKDYALNITQGNYGFNRDIYIKIENEIRNTIRKAIIEGNLVINNVDIVEFL